MQADISSALLQVNYLETPPQNKSRKNNFQIEAVKKGIDESDDPKLQMSTQESLQTILDILNDPVFRQIIQCQDSLQDLNTQIAQHPSMLPNDFDIDLSGNLVLNGPSEHLYDDEQKVPSSGNLSPRSAHHSPVAANGGHFMDSLGKSDNAFNPFVFTFYLFAYPSRRLTDCS